MLKCYNYDIVCQEIPDEITLALNLSGCPNRCPGCHSPWLQEDVGEPLTSEMLDALLDRYGGAITCVCFMGGDGEPGEVARWARYLARAHSGLKIGWYSGRNLFPEPSDLPFFDFIKLGPYIESLGGLRSETTNQRLYRIDSDGRIEIMRLNRHPE